MGGEYVLNSREITGIFDIDVCSVEKRTRNFLLINQREGNIINAAEDLPKSFVVTGEKTYILGISPATLRIRAEKRG